MSITTLHLSPWHTGHGEAELESSRSLNLDQPYEPGHGMSAQKPESEQFASLPWGIELHACSFQQSVLEGMHALLAPLPPE